MGDARLDYDALTLWLVRPFPEGRRQPDPRKDAAGFRYYTMGLNKWQIVGHVAARPGAQPMTFYLASGGKANSLTGDGALAAAAPP